MANIYSHINMMSQTSPRNNAKTSIKIALLTLRVDNNYGGNLQRYAMTKVLNQLGADVTHLFFRSEWPSISFRQKIKSFIFGLAKFILRGERNQIMPWKQENISFESSRSHTYPFYDKYIKHTHLLYSRKSLLRYIKRNDFDAFVVGSDQVWRKKFTHRWGEDLFFLSFVPKNKAIKKIAYGASFGLDTPDYSQEDVFRLSKYYKLFNAVSVRELSGLDILKKIGWTSPQGYFVLDPTMLLRKSHYIELAKSGNTTESSGEMFCYLLDIDKELEDTVNQLSLSKGMQPYFASIVGNNRMSVEQWLRSFMDAKYVVTNSYHGVVFSLIFNKPFKMLYNKERGNARFDSLRHVFNLPGNCDNLDWGAINNTMDHYRCISINFIKQNILI